MIKELTSDYQITHLVSGGKVKPEKNIFNKMMGDMVRLMVNNPVRTAFTSLAVMSACTSYDSFKAAVNSYKQWKESGYDFYKSSISSFVKSGLTALAISAFCAYTAYDNGQFLFNFMEDLMED